MKTFRDLRAWDCAMELAVAVYRVTAAFPDSERFGLTSQMRRAAVSVPSNIAEGQARGSRREFAQFLLIAKGSLAELETQLELATRLTFAPTADLDSVRRLLDEESRVLNGLIRSIRTTAPAPARPTDNWQPSTDNSRSAP